MKKPNARPSTVVVRVFGTAEIRIGERIIGLSAEAMFALALYLTTRAGERISKVDILEVLWPDEEEESRRHSLRQMVYRLRKAGVPVQDKREHVVLDAAVIDSDLRACLDRTWPDRASDVEINAAASLGPTFGSRSPATLHNWFDGIRSEVSAQVCRAALSQLTRARREGRWAELESWSQTVLKSDPLNEEATLARAEAVAMIGSKVAAIEILDSYLADITGFEPLLRKPAEALRKRLAERRTEWGRRLLTDVALVGRKSALAQLTTAIEDTGNGHGASISVLGPAGIGKTRLVSEALGFAALRGVRTVDVLAEAALRSHPLGTLRALVTKLVELPGALATTPGHLALLRDLIAKSVARLPSHAEPLTDNAVSESLHSLLAAISSTVRLVIWVDDGHNADVESRPIIDRCIESSDGLRIVWLVCSRTHQAEWRAGRVSMILPPLQPEDASELATSVCVAQGRSLTHTALADLARRAGGNPMFVTEMVAQFTPGPHQNDVPLTLQSVVRARLGSLEPRQVELLRAVALLGRAASLTRCKAVLRSPMSEIGALATSLEIEGILFLSDERTLALHDCWQQEVLSGLPMIAEATLSHACADAIASTGLHSLDHDDVWRAGTLYSKAGAYRQALDCFLRTADILIERGLFRDAGAALEAARSLPQSGLPRLGIISRECELAHGRGDLTHVLRVTESLPATPEDARTACEDPTEWVLAVAQRVDAVGKTMYSSRVDDSQLRLAVTSEDAHPSARHYAAFVGARQAVWHEDSAALREYFEIGRADAARFGRSLASGFLEILFHAEAGSEADFLVAAERQREIEKFAAPFRRLQQSARFRSVGLRMHGLIDESATVALRTFKSCEEQQQIELASSCAEFLSFLYLDQENAEEGLRWAETGLVSGRDSTNALRTKGLKHARQRALLQLGMAKDVVSQMSGSLDEVLSDRSRTRRAGEILTYCAAAIECGGGARDVRDLLRIAHEDVLACKAAFLTDYPAEMLLRVVTWTEPADSRILFEKLVEDRRRHFPRPLAPFFRHLNAEGDFPIARLSRRIEI